MITKRDIGESTIDRGELGETRENVGEKQITRDNCIKWCRNFQATQLQCRYVILLQDSVSIQYRNSSTITVEPLVQLWIIYQEPYFTTTQGKVSYTLSLYMVNCYPFSSWFNRYVFADDLRFVLALIKRRLNSGNACYHSVQNLLSSRLLSRNIKTRIYKTIILPVVLH
jgi:hypothetical protein